MNQFKTSAARILPCAVAPVFTVYATGAATEPQIEIPLWRKNAWFAPASACAGLEAIERR